MVLYFHNTISGALHPSREQVMERCGVNKEVVIQATRKMRRFGYLHYEQTSGGHNERNTYHLLKRSEIPTVERSGKPTLVVGKTDLQGVGKTDSQIPLEDTTGKKDGSALPLPREGEASASPEEREKRGYQEKRGASLQTHNHLAT